ncbi:MAG: type II toxin-antitoxin system PemK/MazF family toxin [Bdellovibrionales bacterium]|nr:type II toxin-antitoxin system PemK/MazF family toxin [Bdellovibrionales bacterium]
MLRGEVWSVVLDPIKGSEQAGLRPCVIVSPDSMNEQLETIIVVPLTTKKKDWPTRVDTQFDGIEGQALCEQIRTVSKKRLKAKIARLKITEVIQIKSVLKQMFFD